MRARRYNLVGLVMRNRVVTVRGPPGIGKSSLCLMVARFMVERHMFSDGALFVSVRGAVSLEAVLANVLREFRSQDSHTDFTTSDDVEVGWPAGCGCVARAVQ